MRINIRIAVLSLLLVVLVAVGVCTDDSCASTHAVHSPPPATVAEKIISHSLDFRISGETSLRTIGGGTYVKHDGVPYVLTALHVWDVLIEMDNADCIAVCHKNDCVCVSDEDEVASEIVEDWALIRLPRTVEGTKPAKMSKKTFPVGTQVYIVGAPDGVALIVTQGMIAARTNTSREPFPHYMIDGYAYYGSSGGGLFTKRGKLIGVVTSIDTNVGILLGFPFPHENPNLVYATPLSEVSFPSEE